MEGSYGSYPAWEGENYLLWGWKGFPGRPEQDKNKPIKVQVFGLMTAVMKTNQIPYVIFQTTS